MQIDTPKNTSHHTSKVTLLLVMGTSAFLFHFVWEMWQVPFYQGMPGASHWVAVRICSQAAFGDAFIAIFSYALVAWFFNDINWVYLSRRKPVGVYLCIGLLVTIILEYLATEVFYRWQYSELMPRLWWLGTGALPLLQWAFVPFLSLWTAKVFLLGIYANEHLLIGDRVSR